MYSQKMKNPYIGWRKEAFSLMELRYIKDQKEIRKINQAYRKIKREHMKHSMEVEQYFRRKCCFKYGLPKPEYKADYPALVVELKWNKAADTALQQIKDRKYPQSLEQYTGNILLVGINYDKKTKEHSCVIENDKKQ